MSGKRPGPPPKNPEDRVRRNDDAVVTDIHGWQEISPEPYDGDVPDIPAWVGEVSEAAKMIYAELSALPQARLWGPGTWLQLHLSLPMVDTYFNKPGGDGLRTLVNIWGSGLYLTNDDMQRARIRVRDKISEDADEVPADPKVISMEDRRKRLLSGKSSSTPTPLAS
ncbi:hypothetical protein GS982_01370 [Rhodococcus hoagii]|uniref:Uncharacterized protein n=1 Tax=Rhodococcus hoagii TaxID=43767 RepID=A0A9Q4ZIN8_RHOHA|nr:hypothetical protein [Prescottella equi]NKT77257.1 hypothetical protein [Prescottella equi]NKZ81042.1 hypothetical protein [Prescottella equi]